MKHKAVTAILLSWLLATPGWAGEAICYVGGVNEPITIPYDGTPVNILEDLYVSIGDCEGLYCVIRFGIRSNKNEADTELLFSTNFSKGLSSENYTIYGMEFNCKDSRARKVDEGLQKLKEKISGE